MSKLAKELFDGLKRFGTEVGTEFSRLDELARSEGAALIFRGDAFVMYGPGQKAANVEQEHAVFGSTHLMLPHEQEHQPEHDQQHDHQQQQEYEHQLEIER